MRSTIMKLSALALTAGLAIFAVPPANAAPITCPGSQTVEHIDGNWVCVNPAENETGAENPKNPNANKFKF